MFFIFYRFNAVLKAIVLVFASQSIQVLGQSILLPPVNIKIPSELTVEEIIEKAREASKRNGQGDTAFKFYRKASFDELDSKGNFIEKTKLKSIAE